MMPRLFIVLLIISALASCKNRGPVVNISFTDSFMTHQSISTSEKMSKADMDFWAARLRETPGSHTALSRYAGGLIQQFHFYGDIHTLIQADSILHRINKEANEKEAGTFRSLASLDITRHRFKEADLFVQKALAIGSEKYASTLLFFDTRFELGEYTLAYEALKSCATTNEYGYFFRLSKWKHFSGDTDSAVFYMRKAIDWTGTSVSLKQVAISNIADLYMHEGELSKASELYKSDLQQNSSDMHSLRGLGKIALIKDNNIAAAEKIFRFIGTKNNLPDALYDLEWVAEQTGDTAKQKRSAMDFVNKACDSLYGGMYNKYLIELYTGILASPVKALTIVEKELLNRSTPQVYAWYAWSLHKTGNDKKALEVFTTSVSGKPLESLELYWMGKMMKDMGRGYNAGEFFKAADKNHYDLSPCKQKDLKALL